jgi:hypothetical protein
MPKRKREQDSTPASSSSSAEGTNLTLHTLKPDTARETAKYLTLNEIATLARTSISTKALFKPIEYTIKALTAVVWGDPDELARLVKNNPELLFQKGRIKDPSGQIFYDVSPYQLMTFLCDDDMKHQIMRLVLLSMTKKMMRLRQAQYAEIDSGGADLIKMDRDPRLLPFEEVTHFISSYAINSWEPPVTFTLLENTDGIIFYKDATTGLESLYYANKETQKVDLIKPKAPSQKEEHALVRLYASLASMENNSSRRSSNDEHELIAITTHHKLSRKGIQYERDGVRYCDNRMEFGLLKAYRTCIRLYQEIGIDAGAESWRYGVGQAQRRVMWLLQRICEEGRPFYPLPDFKAVPFIRGFKIRHGEKKLMCVNDGLLLDGLGEDFAIYKSANHWGGVAWAGLVGGVAAERLQTVDLIAVHRLIENAKANVVELTQGLDLTVHNAIANPRLSPG